MTFSIGRCKFVITTEFAVSLTAMLMLDLTGILPFILFAVILHELGHAIAAVIEGGKIRAIKMLAFGIEMDIDNFASAFGNNIISFSGIAANLAFSLGFYIIYLYSENTLFLASSAANMAVGIFNSLPVMGLDGGDLLYSFLKLSDRKKEAVCKITSVVFIIVIAGLGIYTTQKNSNPTLLLFCIYSFLCSC